MAMSLSSAAYRRLAVSPAAGSGRTELWKQAPRTARATVSSAVLGSEHRI
ncbi:hypothetical protein [Streptomyces sp. NBC_01508]